ncbi:MAG TPA: hypothetical protein VMS38_33870 [Pseudorhodoferax sp.]|nr:hypothetical protein [Pseudorhodoferax sp.]
MVAVEALSRLFALRLADGKAVVLPQHSGRPVQVGDLLTGDLGVMGFRVFAHGRGFCRAYREAGPLDHEAALVLVHGFAPFPASTRTVALEAARHAALLLTQGHHVDRTLLP